jgi:hypothetical protein
MVLLKTGMDRIRDLIADDLVDGRAGTDGTLASDTDTTLITPVAATEYDVTTTKTAQTILINHTIPSTAANGNDLVEWETRMDGEATSLNRAITAIVSKNSSIEVTRLTTLRLENGQ